MGQIIEVRQVNRIFPVAGGSFQALSDITFTIPEGAFTILRGRSGSGKTTLLNIIGALDMPTSGSIMIDGREIQKMTEREREDMRRTQMGFVFQSVSLIPTMNAFQNVEFSMRLAGIKEEREQRAKDCLRMVGLENRMHHMPAEMSGGEQQRVAIARAVAHRPRILLADEPTAELDSRLAVEVAGLFRELSKQEQVTVLMTTHDTGLLADGDSIVELENGRLAAERK
ncbi:MAG: ABC transporter ATP-binding protein [Lachnospiraceae bacterium]|nr:ABC transporter ATP-binding protein [Lachnospiraceae bacterium]